MDEIVREFIKEKFKEQNEKILKINKLETSGNLTYKLKTAKKEYILRLCGIKKRQRTKNEVQAEVELINFLREKEIPVPKLINFRDDFVIILGDKAGICYEFIDGETTKKTTLTQCYLVGKMLGKIHNLTKNYKFKYPRKRWGLEETRIKFGEVEGLFSTDEYLQKNNFIERLTSILNQLKFERNLPFGAIHEDLGKRHVLFKNNKINGLLDWDRSYSGPFILDLGQTIRGWCFDDWKKLNHQKLTRLLDGYENQRKLSLIEKKSLLNAIKFAFIERVIAFVIFAYNTNKKEYKNHAINDLTLLENLSLNLNLPLD
ncbi:MAG: phosphotransferase [archaeon]|nr:phosphotransferase [archaeon]